MSESPENIQTVGTITQDRANARFRVKYVADGKTRSKVFASRVEANEFRAELIERMPKSKKTTAKKAPRRKRAKAATVDTPKYDGSAKWWDDRCGWWASQLETAYANQSMMDIENAAKAIRAFASLASVQTSHRDVATLEKQLTALERREQEFIKAAEQGLRAA